MIGCCALASLLNEFVKDPYGFLLRVPVFQDKFTFPPPSGIVEFDLKKCGTYAHLAFKDRRMKVDTMKLAYWLRWEPGDLRQLQLGGDAAFFFTSSLTGCQVRVVPGARPIVCHIAGNVTSEDDPYGSSWRVMIISGV